MPINYRNYDPEQRAAEKEENAAISQRLIDGFTSRSDVLQKQAQDSAEDYTRRTLMESSFMHRILPGEPIQPTDLTPDINDRKPYVLVELEPNSTGAITMQFGSVPNTTYFDSERYKVEFNRVLTQRLTMDIVELMRYRYDIREVLMDKQTKYIEFEKDRRFMDTINYALRLTVSLGALGNGMASPRQIRTFGTGLTRENLVDAAQIMPSTSAHLSSSCALCNTKTYAEFAKWQHDEIGGGSEAVDIIMNGLGERNFLGLNWVVSSKHEMIPDGFVYFFANPDYLGKHYILEDLTMFVEHKAYMLTAFQWTSFGAAIGNLSGLALANFSPNQLSDGGTPINAVTQV